MQVSRTQVNELLQSIETFDEVPRAGMSLSATLAANCQRTQIEARRIFGVYLTLDEAGIKSLNQLLSAMHDAMNPGRIARALGKKIPFPSSVLVANTFGAFLGETMRTILGGEWHFVEFGGQKLIALAFSSKDCLFPTYKAGKQFMNGDEDSVWFFYKVATAKHSPNGMKTAITVTAEDLAKDPEIIRRRAKAAHNAE